MLASPPWSSLRKLGICGVRPPPRPTSRVCGNGTHRQVADPRGRGVAAGPGACHPPPRHRSDSGYKRGPGGDHTHTARLTGGLAEIDLLVQASSVPRVPLYLHLPSHSVTSLCSPNSAENDIMWLSATAWRVMSLRLACCGWGLAVYVAL